MTAGELIILDRDGVLNVDSDHYIKRPSEWQPIPGSMESLGQLAAAGYKLAVATNQSGLGRGYFDRGTLYSMHRKLRRLADRQGAQIEMIAYCPHLPGAGCDCRKPKPELLNRIMRRLGFTAAKTWMVGDSKKDVLAAKAAGVRSVLVLSGKSRDGAQVDADEVHQDLRSFTESLLSR